MARSSICGDGDKRGRRWSAVAKRKPTLHLRGKWKNADTVGFMIMGALHNGKQKAA